MAEPLNIFGVDLAGIIHNVLSPMVFDQTLVKITSVRDPLNSSKMTKTEVPYPCKGFIDESSEYAKKGTNINANDKFVVIIGKSLPNGITPEHGDKILAEGKTFTIANGGVERDPAGATYTCQSN